MDIIIEEEIRPILSVERIVASVDGLNIEASSGEIIDQFQHLLKVRNKFVGFNFCFNSYASTTTSQQLIISQCI